MLQKLAANAMIKIFTEAKLWTSYLFYIFRLYTVLTCTVEFGDYEFKEDYDFLNWDSAQVAKYIENQPIEWDNFEIDGKELYRPQEKQKLFHTLIDNRNINGLKYFLYGGAAKGGKSYAMRWQIYKDCLQYDGIKVLFLRKSLQDLRRTHLRFVPHELPAAFAKYNTTTKELRFANGSLVEFGYFAKDKHLSDYLSTEYDIIVMDEMTEIEFGTAKLIMWRLAGSRSDFIPYFMGATNPGNIGHAGVKSFFIDKDFMTEFPELATEYYPEEIAFIPANIFDNELLMKRDPTILRKLMSLPPKERKRFFLGSWDVYEGQFFDMFQREIHMKEPFEIPAHWSKRVGLDYGGTTCAICIAEDPEGNIYVCHEWTVEKLSKSLRAENFWKFLVNIGWTKERVSYDTNMNATYDELPGEKTAAEAFKEYGPLMTAVSKIKNAENQRTFRVWCNDVLKDLLFWRKGKTGLFIQKPKLFIFKQRCPKLVKNLPLLMTDPHFDDDYDKELDMTIGHWIKALQYALMDIRTPVSLQKQNEAKKAAAKRKAKRYY